MSVLRPSAAAAAIALLLALPALAGSPWSKVKTSSPGPALAIGAAANGCIAGALALPAEGDGYVSIRRERNRFYGHPHTLALVRDLGTETAYRTGGLMVVGDLAQPRGGLMSSSHRSHQNGMDVDIWFSFADSAREAWRTWPEDNPPPSMATPDGLGVVPQWGPRQRDLLRSAALHPRTDRIFVNPAIKQHLCTSERGDRGWLRRLRPWWGHDAHFHVRLLCPADSPACEAQAALPAGEGCGSDLAWWLSDEAKKPSKKPEKAAPAPMPAACRALLGAL